MADSILRFGPLVAAFGIILSACMPTEAPNFYQSQYLSTRTICQPGMHAIPRMRGSGYRCVPN
jgi:hypothetical protein